MTPLPNTQIGLKQFLPPKIQEDRFEEIYVDGQQDMTITPDAGYDAMSEVYVSITVNYTNIQSISFKKTVSIAEGVSFNVPLGTLNIVDLVVLEGFEDLDDLETKRIDARIPISELNQNFILGEVTGQSVPYSRMWLSKYQYNETEKVLTVTVLQQITL